MNAEIIAVGTELLLGDIVNTNAQYLSKQLAVCGINVFRQTVVGDNTERLTAAFSHAFLNCDLIITCGGLGPTDDDLTKETAGKFLGMEMVLCEDVLNDIRSYFQRISMEMTPNNEKQAYIPESSITLKNNNGTAPGSILEKNDKVIITLPGPPQELIPMFEESVLPYLREKQEQTFVSQIVKLCGIGESAVENQIKDLIESQTNPTIAPYAKDSEVHLRITAAAENEETANLLIKPIVEELYRRFPDDIYTIGSDTLEESLLKLLQEKQLTMSVAESCTGGMLAARLINCSGISSHFMEGVVTYSNESKIKRLGVSEETIAKHGAVSHETAYEMAEGIKNNRVGVANVNIGLSTTGIAGPEGGTEEKPVGLVYIGLSIDNEVKTRELRLSGNRHKIRSRAVVTAIDWLRRELKNRG